jgi:hypothetical protein
LRRTLFALPLVAGVAAALVAALFGVSDGGLPHRPAPASAEILPAECGPTTGTAAASVRIQSVPANPADGDVLAYKVGAAYPAAGGGIGCTVFDVDVFLKKPGSSAFLFVCNIPTLVSGSGTVECPAASNYTVNGADRNDGGDLIATVHVMGNKHDRKLDCLFEASPRDATKIDPCFDASAISRLAQVNTPTSTPTQTPVPTDTPVPPNIPAPVDTPTLVVGVLSERASSRAVTGQVTLPNTGTGEAGATPAWTILALVLAGGGMALGSAGRRASRSRHR